LLCNSVLLYAIYETQPKYTVSDAMFIDTAVERFAEQRNYSINGYNCVNYSNDFKQLMNQFGYDIDVIVGINETNSTAHAWNVVSFEPQGMGFVDYKAKYPTKRRLE